jgi:predicted MFS family arabinose efflux permease
LSAGAKTDDAGQQANPPAGDTEHLGVIASLRALPTVARFVLLGVFINQFGAFLQVFLVLYLGHRGFSDDQAGFALGAYGLGAIIGLFSGGGLSDRLGPRVTIALSMGTSAVMVTAISLLDSYPVILVAVALAGAMTQANRPASAALLTGVTPASRHVMVMAMNRIALSSGTVAGPLVGAWVITVSWNLLLWLDGATALMYALIALFLLPRREKPGDGTASADAGRRATYLTVLRDLRFVVYLAAMLTNALVHIQYYAVLPIALRDDGYPTVVYSAVFAVTAGMVMTCELWVTKYTQRWRPWLAGSVGLALLGLGLTGFGLPGGLVMILAATVVGAVGQMVAAPTLFSWPVRVAPGAAKGRYLGAALAMFSLGYAVGPMVGVPAYQRLEQVGNGDLVWWVCGAVSLVSALAAALSMRLRPGQSGSADPAVPADATEPDSMAQADAAAGPVPAQGGDLADAATDTSTGTGVHKGEV